MSAFLFVFAWLLETHFLAGQYTSSLLSWLRCLYAFCIFPLCHALVLGNQIHWFLWALRNLLKLFDDLHDFWHIIGKLCCTWGLLDFWLWFAGRLLLHHMWFSFYECMFPYKVTLILNILLSTHNTRDLLLTTQPTLNLILTDDSTLDLILAADSAWDLFMATNFTRNLILATDSAWDFFLTTHSTRDIIISTNSKVLIYIFDTSSLLFTKQVSWFLLL